MAVVTTTFKAFYPEWQSAFEDWALTARLGIVDAWRYQAKQIADVLVNGNRAEVKKGFWNRSTPPNERKQGENAVNRDVRRSIYSLDAASFRDIKIKRKVTVAITNNDVGTLQQMVSSGLFGSAQVHAKVLPAGNEYTAHQDSRDSRGRGPQKGTAPKYAIPQRSYLKNYIKDAVRGVGEAKGGWAASFIKLGGSCAGWISKHVRSGTCIDNLRDGAEPLTFSMINRSRWASSGDDDRIVETVIGDRAEMVKADIAAMLEKGFYRTATGRSYRA